MPLSDLSLREIRIVADAGDATLMKSHQNSNGCGATRKYRCMNITGTGSPRSLLSILTLALLLLPCALDPAVRAAEPESVTVFAAASTTNAINDICKIFAEKGKGKVVPSFASSSTLAKQIENGAPANVFISADEPWMNYLEERKLIEPGSRFNLLGNKLVAHSPIGQLSQQGGNRSENGPG